VKRLGGRRNPKQFNCDQTSSHRVRAVLYTGVRSSASLDDSAPCYGLLVARGGHEPNNRIGRAGDLVGQAQNDGESTVNVVEFVARQQTVRVP